MSLDLQTVERAQAVLDLRRLLRLLRRGWWLLALAVIAGLAAGLLLSPARPVRSSVRLLVAANPPPGGSGADQVISLDTEAGVLQSDEVLTATLSNLGIAVSGADLQDRLRGLRDRLTVTGVPATQILEINFDASRPEEARRGAKATADAYLAVRAAHVKRDRDAESGQLLQQIAAAQDRFNDLANKIAPLPVDVPERIALESQLRSTTEGAASLQQSLDALNRARINPGEELIPPSDPKPSGIPPMAFAFGGGLTGLTLGFGLALLLDRILEGRSLESLVRAVGGTVVDLPSVRAPRLQQGAESGAYVALLLALEAGRGRVVAITSVDGNAPGDLAANVAWLATGRGIPTLLIGSNGASSSMLRGDGGPAALRKPDGDDAALPAEEPVAVRDRPGLSVLALDRTEEKLLSEHVRLAIEAAVEAGSWVVLDLPALPSSPASRWWAAQVTAVAVQAGPSARRRDVIEVLEQVSLGQAHPVLVAVTRDESSAAPRTVRDHRQERPLGQVGRSRAPAGESRPRPSAAESPE